MPNNTATKKLNTVTPVDRISDNDSLIIANNNAYVTKINYNLLAKAIIEEYTGSFLAGENQSIKNAMATINGDLSQTPVLITDFNDATDPLKNYYADSSTTNAPRTGESWYVRVINITGTSNIYQLAQLKNTQNIEAYMRISNNSTFGKWMPISTDHQPTYRIQYSSIYSVNTTGFIYNTSSISRAINDIANKGSGRYYVICTTLGERYSDSYKKFTSDNVTFIVDVVSSTSVSMIGLSYDNANNSIILRRIKDSQGWHNWENLTNYTYQLNSGIDITGGDLNDYNTPGNYRCTNAVVAESMDNCPVNTVFIMKVEAANGMYDSDANYNRIRQTVWSEDTGDIYIRSIDYNNGLQIAEDWQKLPTRYDITSINNNINAINNKTAHTNWGTTLSVTSTGTIHGVLLIANYLYVQVWMPATSDINIFVMSPSGNYAKAGTNSLSFGTTSSATTYTLERTGNKSFTFTSSETSTLTWISY